MKQCKYDRIAEVEDRETQVEKLVLKLNSLIVKLNGMLDKQPNAKELRSNVPGSRQGSRASSPRGAGRSTSTRKRGEGRRSRRSSIRQSIADLSEAVGNTMKWLMGEGVPPSIPEEEGGPAQAAA